MAEEKEDKYLSTNITLALKAFFIAMAIVRGPGSSSAVELHACFKHGQPRQPRCMERSTGGNTRQDGQTADRAKHTGLIFTAMFFTRIVHVLMLISMCTFQREERRDGIVDASVVGGKASSPPEDLDSQDSRQHFPLVWPLLPMPHERRKA